MVVILLIASDMGSVLSKIVHYDKAICSVKHNKYVVINTQLATCFGSSEPSSGQYLIYRHGAFSECTHFKNWPEDGPLEPKHVANYTGRFITFSVLTNIYNKKIKGPTLMELFTATGQLKKFFFLQLEMFDVCTTGDTAHIEHL